MFQEKRGFVKFIVLNVKVNLEKSIFLTRPEFRQFELKFKKEVISECLYLRNLEDLLDRQTDRATIIFHM